MQVETKVQKDELQRQRDALQRQIDLFEEQRRQHWLIIGTTDYTGLVQQTKRPEHRETTKLPITATSEHHTRRSSAAGLVEKRKSPDRRRTNNKQPSIMEITEDRTRRLGVPGLMQQTRSPQYETTNYQPKHQDVSLRSLSPSELVRLRNAAGGSEPRHCLLYTSPSPRDRTRSRMPSSA